MVTLTSTCSDHLALINPEVPLMSKTWAAVWATGHMIRNPVCVVQLLNGREKSLLNLHISYQETTDFPSFPSVVT